MSGFPTDLPDEWSTAWYLIRRTAALMDRAGDDMFRSELGISLAQFLVLSVVDAHPGQLNQQAVADRLGLTKGTISRQIENAVTAGLMTVAVSAHSRRENTVALTQEGTEMVRRGDQIFQAYRDELATDVSERDLKAIIRTLTTMVEKLDPSALHRRGSSNRIPRAYDASTNRVVG